MLNYQRVSVQSFHWQIVHNLRVEAWDRYLFVSIVIIFLLAGRWRSCYGTMGELSPIYGHWNGENDDFHHWLHGQTCQKNSKSKLFNNYLRYIYIYNYTYIHIYIHIFLGMNIHKSQLFWTEKNQGFDTKGIWPSKASCDSPNPLPILCDVRPCLLIKWWFTDHIYADMHRSQICVTWPPLNLAQA
jgi:hypothetical protein